MEPDRVYRSIGLEPDHRRNPLEPLPLLRYFEVMHGASRWLELPEIGVVIGECVQISNLVRLAPIVDDSQTLAEALWRVCQAFNRTILPGCCVAVSTHQDRCSVQLEMPVGSAERRRPVTEMMMLILRCIARRALGSAWNPTRVRLRHGASSSIAALERTLGSPCVELDQDRDGIEFSSALLDERVPNRSLDLDRLRHVIQYELLRGNTHIDDLAQLYGISRRSLQRRMKQQGVTYKRLLLELRMDAALGYLGHERTPVGSVAKYLGYAHQADFTRAFKARFGVTPSKHRQQSRRPAVT